MGILEQLTTTTGLVGGAVFCLDTKDQVHKATTSFVV